MYPTVWNYRVVRRTGKYHNSYSYAIHEVYYTPEGVAVSMTAEPLSLANPSMEGLKEDLEHMMRAFLKPMIDYDNLKEIGAKRLESGA